MEGCRGHRPMDNVNGLHGLQSGSDRAGWEKLQIAEFSGPTTVETQGGHTNHICRNTH
jgi:hypothetical protein